MNFLNIKYFIAIAEEQSISAAARKLYVSQQSLSEHLKKMETELGVPLFNRGSTLTLTVAGECFFEGGKELLNTYDRLLSDINDITTNRKSKFTVGISTYSEPPFLPDLLTQYCEKYPQYEVSVIKRWHIDILHNMQYVDLYISYLPLEEGLDAIPLIENDPYCVTFHRDLAGKVYGDRWPSVEKQLLETQDLSRLKDMPFLLLYDRHNQMVQDLSNIFAEYQFTPKAGFVSENGDLLDDMCPRGIGCLLHPTDYIKRRFGGTSQELPKELLSYPIKVTSFRSTLAVCFSKGKRLHAAELCFIKTAREFLTN